MISPTAILVLALLFICPVSAQEKQAAPETFDNLLDSVYFLYCGLPPIPDVMIQNLRDGAVFFSQRNVNDSRPKMLVLFLDAELARQQKKLDIAKTTFEQALKTDSSTILPWLGFAETCIDRNEGDKALLYLLSAKLLTPTSVPEENQHLRFSQIGEFYEAMGRYTDAIELYQLAVTKNPNWAMGQRNLALAYITTNQPNRALPYVRKAIMLEPKEARNFAILAMVQSDLNDNRAAIESFQKALDLDPGNALYHWQLGDAFAAAGEKMSALRSYTTALNIAEKNKKYSDLVERIKSAIDRIMK